MKEKRINHLSIVLLCLGFTLVFNNLLYAESLYKSSKKGLEAFEKGDFDKAVDYYTASQLEAPENHEVFYNLGNAQYKKGDYELALNNYLKVLPSENKTLKEKAYFNIGNTYFRQGDYEESIKQYENAVKLNPDDLEAKKNIEFVKKVIEQQKKQQDQDKQDQDKKDQDKKDQDKKDQDKKDQDKKDQDKKDQDKKDQDKKEGEQPPQPKPDEKNEPEKEKTQSARQNDDKAKKDKKQAERMLNRLEDNPGKALMPVYENKKIEKDW